MFGNLPSICVKRTLIVRRPRFPETAREQSQARSRNQSRRRYRIRAHRPTTRRRLPRYPRIHHTGTTAPALAPAPQAPAARQCALSCHAPEHRRAPNPDHRIGERASVVPNRTRVRGVVIGKRPTAPPSHLDNVFFFSEGAAEELLARALRRPG